MKRVRRRLVWTQTNKHITIYSYLCGSSALFTENLQVILDRYLRAN